MRILMLSWRGPTHPKAGGAEVYTEDILKGLVERGHEVEWFSAAYEGHRPPTYKGISLSYGASGIKVYPSGFFYAKKKKDDVDIIIDQINVFGFLTPKAGATSVTLIHQLAENVWEAEVKPPVSWIGKQMERQMLQLYNQTPYITVSPSTEKDLRDIGWKGEGVIVPNGIETDPKSFQKAGHPVLVFLARFGAKAKRLDHAVTIFEQVRSFYSNAELWVIGRGTPPEWLSSHQHVKVFQNVSNEQRDQLIGSAWCCLATSVREGWGRMVLESAVYGTPSVVYDVHGLRDAVIHEQTGYIVPEDTEKAAARIIELFQSPETLKKLGENAKKHAQTFTWERSIDLFEAMLERTVYKKKE